MPAPKGNKNAAGSLNSGRPTDYREEYAEQARKLCLLGATDAELADFFEVHIDTIQQWKSVHIEFSDSIKKGKALADSNVAERLYQRALGYEHDEDDIRVVDHGIVITPTRKYYPPDTAAGIFWLKNRQKAKWRDKQEIEATVQNKSKPDWLTGPVANEPD